MTFEVIAALIGSITVAVVSTTAVVTLLLRRRESEAKRKPWLKPMLEQMAHADAHRGRINPVRLNLQKL